MAFAVKNLDFDFLPSTDNDYRASWEFTDSHLDNFSVQVQYYTVTSDAVKKSSGTYVSEGAWVTGTTTTTASKYFIYSAPSNCTNIRIRVRPNSKKNKGKAKAVWWTGTWSSWVSIKIEKYGSYYPQTPSVPIIEIDDTNEENVKFIVEGLDPNRSTYVRFAWYTNNANGQANNFKVTNGKCVYTFKGQPGATYKVKAQTIYERAATNSSTKLQFKSDYSLYSDDFNFSPLAPTDFRISISKVDQLKLEWTKPSGAVKYEYEYALSEEELNSKSGSYQSAMVDLSTELTFVDGMSTGQWYFRLRAYNIQDRHSQWTEIVPVIIGTKPSPPTTWSSTSTGVIKDGENTTLYWVHNTQDGSPHSSSILQMTLNGVDLPEEVIPNDERDEYGNLKTVTSHKELSNSDYSDSDEILWKVKTKGIYDNGSSTKKPEVVNLSVKTPPNVDLDIGCDIGIGDTIRVTSPKVFTHYSVSITTRYDDAFVDRIYSATGGGMVSIDETIIATGKANKIRLFTSAYSSDFTIEITKAVPDDGYSDWSIQRSIKMYDEPSVQIELSELDTITHYPIVANLTALPTSQKSVGFTVEVIANTSYYDDNFVTGDRYVNVGDTIYSRYINVDNNSLSLELTPGDIRLQNGENYTIRCTASFSSGLSAVSETTFDTDFTDIDIDVSASCLYSDTYKFMNITPLCIIPDGSVINPNDILLSVYRVDSHGRFISISENTPNSESVTVTDPHPTLRSVTYRIVATDPISGQSTYSDITEDVPDTSIIIQWDDEWRSQLYDDDREDPTWGGSILIMPYNIDVSESNNPDVKHVEYIGRDRSVSYYGTQLGENPTWNCSVPKSDTETLLLLRKLSRYMGDVYIREPSGLGYWASVTVNFSQTHAELTIPVSINIKPVEGGA